MKSTISLLAVSLLFIGCASPPSDSAAVGRPENGAIENPSFSYKLSGSSFIVFATNNKDQRFQCEFSYVLDFSVNGVTVRNLYNNFFFVGPSKNNAIVLREDTPYPASKYDDVAYVCVLDDQ